MSKTKEFETALARLDEDLSELESLSTHLREVKAFSEETKELGAKFNKHIEESAKLVEDSTNSLNKFVDENGANIKALTDSHQSLAGRVKDMEDKVTVLNTKAETMAKDIGRQIKNTETKLEATSKTLKEHVEKQSKLILYFSIPSILILITLMILAFIP